MFIKYNRSEIITLRYGIPLAAVIDWKVKALAFGELAHERPEVTLIMLPHLTNTGFLVVTPPLAHPATIPGSAASTTLLLPPPLRPRSPVRCRDACTSFIQRDRRS